jgi:hypothetical protein
VNQVERARSEQMLDVPNAAWANNGGILKELGQRRRCELP